MPSFELMTAKVVDEVDGYRLLHFPCNRQSYYQRDKHNATSYVGWYATNKAAKAMWRGQLRSQGVHV